MSKAKDIILRILQKKSSITTFHLAKLTYLFDLAYAQLFNKTDTKLPYIWDRHGPYCQEFVKAVQELDQVDKKIYITPHITREARDCRLHSARERIPPKLSKIEEDLLSYIINRFSNLSTDDLKKFVYNTPPMKEAQKLRNRSIPLNLTTNFKDEECIIPDAETAKCILNAEKVTLDRYIPADEVLKKFETELVKAGL